MPIDSFRMRQAMRVRTHACVHVQGRAEMRCMRRWSIAAISSSFGPGAQGCSLISGTLCSQGGVRGHTQSATATHKDWVAFAFSPHPGQGCLGSSEGLLQMPRAAFLHGVRTKEGRRPRQGESAQSQESGYDAPVFRVPAHLHNAPGPCTLHPFAPYTHLHPAPGSTSRCHHMIAHSAKGAPAKTAAKTL